MIKHQCGSIAMSARRCELELGHQGMHQASERLSNGIHALHSWVTEHQSIDSIRPPSGYQMGWRLFPWPSPLDPPLNDYEVSG